MSQRTPPSNLPPSAPAGAGALDLSVLFSPGGGGLPGEEVEENLDGEEQNALQETTPPVESPPAPPDPAALMQEQLKAQQGLTEALRGFLQHQQQPAAPAVPAAAAEPEVPKFLVRPEAVPQQMVTLLNSEDPAERLQGLVAFGNALMGQLYKQIQTDVTEKYQPQYETLVRDHYTQQVKLQEFRQEFTTKFPVLTSTPQGNVVGQFVTQEVAKELQAAGKPAVWGSEFEKAMVTKLKALNIDPVKGWLGAAAPRPPAAPHRLARANARPAAPSGAATSEQDQMMSVLQLVRR